MAEIAISLAISAAVSAASAGLQYALTPKPKKPAAIDRGKLDDIRISLPAYGAQIVKAWGTFRCAPTWFWHTPAIDLPITTSGQQGGKGGGAPPTADVTEHRYFKSMAGVFHEGQIQYVRRIWFDNELVMNNDGPTLQSGTSSTRYEAENGVLAGGAMVVTQAECSEGRKVTGIGSGGSVTIHCDVASTGSYEVAVGYTSTVDRTFKISVNGGAAVDLVCPASGGAGLVAVQTITFSLTSGANTIAFSNSGATAPDLDYIAIAPALSFTNGVDTRSFTGLQTPGRIPPSDPDIAWPVNDEPPTFTDSTGGLAGNNSQTTTLAKWGSPQIRIYLGSEAQMPDSLIESIKGVGNTSANRGTAYIVIEGLMLQGGRIPNVTIEFIEGTRAASAIITDISEMTGLTASDLELSALSGLILGDSTGFNPGTYTPITWSGLNNATQTGNGAITKTSGTNNTWNAYAVQGTTVSAGTDAAIRFTAGSAGTYMIGFSITATPGSSLPNPYNQVPFAILLNDTGNPSQTTKKAIQMSLGGSTNTTDIGVWAPGDTFQVEIRNGRFRVYQNGQLLGGFIPPPATFPLHPIFVGYAISGGPSAASYATGANIGSEPIIVDAGALVLDSQREAGELIEEMMTRFQFILPEVDGKIKAVLLSAASDLTLTEAECQAYRGGGLPPKIQISRKNPLTFPKKTIVNYSDPQLDYHANAQVETRLFGPQKSTLNVNLAMVETGANMKQLAAVLSTRAEVEGQTYRFIVGPKHKHVHQGTVLTITEGSSTHQIRVTNFRPDLPAGLGEVEAVRQSSVFDPTVVTQPIGTEKPIVPIPGNTKGVFIDAPLVEPESAGDEVKPLMYAAMCGRGSGVWPAAFLLREFPLNSGQFVVVAHSEVQASIGQTSGALPTWTDPSTKDTTSSLVVDFHSDTEVESVTEAEILANGKLNLLAVKNPSTGDVEYVQFQTATLGAASAPFIKRYTFTNLLRGRYETIDQASAHTSADEVVLMNSAVKVLVMTTALLGVSCNYKFVTAGQDVDDAPTVVNTWRGVSMKPPAPSDLMAVRDSSGDWHIGATHNGRTGDPLDFVARIRRPLDNVTMRDLPISLGVTQSAIFAESFGPITINKNGLSTATTSDFVEMGARTAQEFTETGTYLEFTLPALSQFPGGSVRLALFHSDDATWNTPSAWTAGVYTLFMSPKNTTTGEWGLYVWDVGGQNAGQVLLTNQSIGLGPVKLRLVFVGTELRVYKNWSNASATPLVISKVPPTSHFPMKAVFYLVSGGGAFDNNDAARVSDIVRGGTAEPSTIYSLAQQQHDNSGLGLSSIDVEFWQRGSVVDGLSVRRVFP